MFPRAFFAICALVLFATVTIRAENVEVEKISEVRNPLLAAAVRILGKAFAWATKNCLEEAANKCKGDWKNPGNLIKCGGKFLQENKGRCVVG